MSKDEKMSRALAIAENIQLILDNSGFSEEEIADKLQIDHTLLKKWALAEETPTKEELEHIVSTFGLYKTYFKNNSEKNNSEVLWIKKKYMFAKQLRKALKSKKITIERFSKELGVLPLSVNKWLTGTYMPTEERGTIGQVKPSGWHTVKYDCVNGKYLYNRCHLIGYQLTGENANPKNLITGTRYLNIEGMLPFENMVADYVKETDNHVMYRVTPIFKGNNLLASGVQMEGYSVEDKGEGISFNVYAYNVQPNIKIDYATGDSSYNGVSAQPTTQKPKVKKKVQPTTTYSYNAGSSNNESSTYILNANSKKFHVPSCSAVSRMKDSNKQAYTGSRSSLISQGYDPCKICNP